MSAVSRLGDLDASKTIRTEVVSVRAVRLHGWPGANTRSALRSRHQLLESAELSECWIHLWSSEHRQTLCSMPAGARQTKYFELCLRSRRWRQADNGG